MSEQPVFPQYQPPTNPKGIPVAHPTAQKPLFKLARLLMRTNTKLRMHIVRGHKTHNPPAISRRKKAKIE